MAHRLLHSLVFSSVMVLEGLGCAISHDGRDDASAPPPVPPERLDLPWRLTPPDGGDSDASTSDAAAPPDGSDTSDASRDRRFCEPGWPTTKASYCAVVDMDTEFERIECCNSFGEEPCCTAREAGPEVVDRLRRVEP